MLHHLDTFWQVRDRPNIVLLRYEDLLDDLEGQMRYVADRLGIAIAETVWPNLIQAATFEDMKGRASELAAEASHDRFYNDRDQFFRKGSTGQWRHILSDDDLLRYAARVAEWAPADLAAWIHRLPLPAAGDSRTPARLIDRTAAAGSGRGRVHERADVRNAPAGP